MDEQALPPLTAIDQIANGESLQMLKAAIPYTPYENQKFLAVFIKMIEMQNIVSFYESPSSMKACSLGGNLTDPSEMLNDMKRYASPSQREQLNSFTNMMNMMQMFETFQNMSGQTSQGGGSLNPMDMVKGMLSPDQQAMFDVYSTMFESNESEESYGSELDE